jgi:YbbR domain-containing protein
MELIQRNFGLKVLALVLAIVGWAYFRFAANPILGSAPFDQQLSIPITAANLPLGYVAHFIDREAVVTVAGKRGDPAIKPEQIKAVLDLANKGAGIYNVPVQLVAPDLVVQSLSPASVTLTIERVEQRIFPVAVHFVNAPASVVLNAALVRPSSATVSGATSALTQVAAVHVDVVLPSSPKTIDEMVRPFAVDAAGAEVNGLTVSPDLVRVRVGIINSAVR